MNEQEKMALRGVLSVDRQAWPTVAELVDDPAVMSRPVLIAKVRGSRDQVLARTEALANKVGDLGLESKVEPPMVLMTDAVEILEVLQFLGSVVVGLKGVKVLNDALVAGKEIPGNLRGLIGAIAGDVDEIECHELLALAAVSRWLNDTYGAGAWVYDPDRVEVKRLAEFTIVDLTETKSGRRHLLAVRGDEVHEVPAAWRC